MYVMGVLLFPSGMPVFSLLFHLIVRQDFEELTSVKGTENLKVKRKCLSFIIYKTNIQVSADSETNLCCNARTSSVWGEEECCDAVKPTKIKLNFQCTVRQDTSAACAVNICTT